MEEIQRLNKILTQIEIQEAASKIHGMVTQTNPQPVIIQSSKQKASRNI